ncbi:MAG: uncharacterized protein PWQ88_39 [Candidatus Methanomethylophilaceae archaeon]|nr:uncharacterized protein [Candidatus Methanomethylophilaceae archaeon]MDI3541820.1 uncharacterized protein [Candidatus Methanomethylophilaceae archaeon]
MMSIEVCPGVRLNADRTLYMEGSRTLVVADLHLGYEKALESDGLYLPRTHTMNVIGDLLRAIERERAERVVVLGDVKHDFQRGQWECRDDVRAVISLLAESSKCILVRGNHDNFLLNMIGDMDVEVVDHIYIENFYLEHGHVDSGVRPAIIGHEHPSVRILDRVGGFVKIPCFLHVPSKKVTVIPAFSPMAPGNDLCNGIHPEPFSPALMGCDEKDVYVYGCTEIGIINLGKLGELKDLRF